MTSGRERERREQPGAPATVFLVGMMGTGKTTVGRALADRLGARFVDTDAAIVAEVGLSIAQIFEFRGEAAFREVERTVVLREAAQGGVVALGGGAYAQPGAPEALREFGPCVYLRARPETLALRTAEGGRPLLAGLSTEERRERLAALLDERGPAYARADWEIEVDDRAPDEIAARIHEDLQEWEVAHSQPARPGQLDASDNGDAGEGPKDEKTDGSN